MTVQSQDAITKTIREKPDDPVKRLTSLLLGAPAADAETAETADALRAEIAQLRRQISGSSGSAPPPPAAATPAAVSPWGSPLLTALPDGPGLAATPTDLETTVAPGGSLAAAVAACRPGAKIGVSAGTYVLSSPLILPPDKAVHLIALGHVTITATPELSAATAGAWDGASGGLLWAVRANAPGAACLIASLSPHATLAGFTLIMDSPPAPGAGRPQAAAVAVAAGFLGLSKCVLISGGGAAGVLAGGKAALVALRDCAVTGGAAGVVVAGRAGAVLDTVALWGAASGGLLASGGGRALAHGCELWDGGAVGAGARAADLTLVRCRLGRPLASADGGGGGGQGPSQAAGVAFAADRFVGLGRCRLEGCEISGHRAGLSVEVATVAPPSPSESESESLANGGDEAGGDDGDDEDDEGDEVVVGVVGHLDGPGAAAAVSASLRWPTGAPGLLIRDCRFTGNEVGMLMADAPTGTTVLQDNTAADNLLGLRWQRVTFGAPVPPAVLICAGNTLERNWAGGALLEMGNGLEAAFGGDDDVGDSAGAASLAGGGSHSAAGRRGPGNTFDGNGHRVGDVATAWPWVASLVDAALAARVGGDGLRIECSVEGGAGGTAGRGRVAFSGADNASRRSGGAGICVAAWPGPGGQQGVKGALVPVDGVDVDVGAVDVSGNRGPGLFFFGC